MKVKTIGRIPDNDIVIDDANVSRNHVQIVQHDDETYSVVDLNSTNGTFVNGQRITGEVSLQIKDVLQIGNTKLPWQGYFEPQKPPKPKPKILIIAAAVLVLLLVSGGVFWKIKHDREVKIEQQKQAEEETKRLEKEKLNAKKEDIKEFNDLREIAEGMKSSNLPIPDLLNRMKQIASKYPDNEEMQSTIKKLEK